MADIPADCPSSDSAWLEIGVAATSAVLSYCVGATFGLVVYDKRTYSVLAAAWAVSLSVAVVAGLQGGAPLVHAL